MFDLVQEREIGGTLTRTMIYLLVHAEHNYNHTGLSERGRNQVMELARSRLIPVVKTLYSAKSDVCKQTAMMLQKEFGSRMETIECLSEIDIGVKLDDEKAYEIISELWKDESQPAPNGESLLAAQKRMRDCIMNLAKRNSGDVIAVVTHPLVAVLFNLLVVGGPPRVEDWLYLGHASCATYEYSKDGWTLVMPFDDSFLSSPAKIADGLPPGLF